jgi:hypothetical protein
MVNTIFLPSAVFKSDLLSEGEYSNMHQHFPLPVLNMCPVFCNTEYFTLVKNMKDLLIALSVAGNKDGVVFSCISIEGLSLQEMLGNFTGTWTILGCLHQERV